MRKIVLSGIATGLLASVSIGAAIHTMAASSSTQCWDEYNTRGTRLYGTVVPMSSKKSDCTPGEGCYWGYDTSGARTRLYVPYKKTPQSCTTPTSTTTTTPATTTTAPHSTTPQRFTLQPVGAELPSDSDCANRVRKMTENRPENATANATRGTAPNSRFPRVTGNFTGTTDEIIQWTACKWGIDEDMVRAQIVVESGWKQTAKGDFTTDATACTPDFPIGNYPPSWNGDREHNQECPESIGLGQVRYVYHKSAFVDSNAIKSSAYNLDYTYANWRECFEGSQGWLNTVERGATYAAGDAKGCLGVWFSGRWYTDAAKNYIATFDQTLASRTWEQSWFPPTVPAAAPAPPAATTTTTIVKPATTVATTTTIVKPATTVATTTTTVKPATTVATTTTTVKPATTVATTTTTTTAAPTTPAPSPAGQVPGDAQFVATFDGNTGLDRFNFGLWHRDPYVVAMTEWQGDHDLNCNGPDTTRTIHRSNPSESFYMCKDHLMTSVGDTSGSSIAWLSPNMSFNSITEVSFNVNLTNLGMRKWWKVGIVSEAVFNSTYNGSCCGPAPGFLHLDGELDTANVLWFTWNENQPHGLIQIGWDLGPFPGVQANPSPTDKATRWPVSVRDNKNGTVSFSVAGNTLTTANALPKCPCRVVFTDENYTPNKATDQQVSNPYTWHWDNIVVR